MSTVKVSGGVGEASVLSLLGRVRTDELRQYLFFLAPVSFEWIVVGVVYWVLRQVASRRPRVL